MSARSSLHETSEVAVDMNVRSSIHETSEVAFGLSTRRIMCNTCHLFLV